MNTERADGRFRLAEWVVDPAIDEIGSPSARQKLEPRTMRLLLCLAKAGKGVVSTETLLDEVWQGVVVGPSSVYQAVSNLRRLLGDTDTTPRLIATVPRKGYRLLVAPEWLVEGSETQVTTDKPPDTSDSTGTRRRHSDRNWATRHPWVSALILGIAGFVAVAMAYQYFAPRFEKTPSIAVLPFVDLTPGGGQQTFGDGLSEELSNWLAQLPSMRVVARTSAFSFRGRDRDVRDIGRELSASHVLEGSIRRAGDRIRVTAQLIDARSGYHVWSQSLDRPFSDVISIQDQIARAVAQALELRLSSVEVRRFGERTPEGARAFELYLLGREANYDRSPEGNAKALSFFGQAIELDPKFALAHAARALTLLDQIAILNATPVSVLESAREAASTSLALAPDLPEGHAAMAEVRSAANDRAGALKEIDRALELNPNSITVLVQRGELLRSEGRVREALATAQRAVALDPIDWLRHADLCVIGRDAGEYPLAEQACARARELEGEGPWSRMDSAWLEYSRGRLDKAVGWILQADKFRPDDPWIRGPAGDWLTLLGRTQEASRLSSPTPGSLDAGSRLYLERGAGELRAWLSGAAPAEGATSLELFNWAWLHLQAGEIQQAQKYAERAQAAPDFTPDFIDGVDALRLGGSAGPILLEIAVAQGKTKEAAVLRSRIEARIDALEAGGLRAFGLHMTRAEMAALTGQDAEAVSLLKDAFTAGWRGLAWIEREPPWTRIRGRSDYQALAAQIRADLAAQNAALPPI